MASSINLLRINDVKARVGMGVSTIYALIAEGKFPKPITILKRHKAWPSPLIDSYVDDVIKADAAAQRAGVLQ